MELFKFQTDASETIVKRFDEYYKDPLMINKQKSIPFYQSLSSITGSGKTVILADTLARIRAILPLEPIVLWISKGKVVVEQTLQNLSVGKYASLVSNFEVVPLLDATPDQISDSSKALLLIATVAKFNQKDREDGDRKIFRSELDFSENTLWDSLKSRWDSEKRKRPFVIVYDEGHNLSDQQTEILLELSPDAVISASATTRVPEALDRIIQRLRDDKDWKDEDLTTIIKSSDVVDAKLIKRNIQLGGYVTPMEVAIDDLLEQMTDVAMKAKSLGLSLNPKAIYVSTTNVVETASHEDSTRTPFNERQARPIVIWRHLVGKRGIDPKDIAVYCNLKFGKENPPPPEFKLFAGGDSDYQNFSAGNYRHIIFNLGLQEGWDDPACYFAYIDKEMGSKLQVTQIIGRVLRQPDAEHYADDRLNSAHLFVRADAKNVFDEVVEEVRKQLASDAPDIKLTVYKAKTGAKFKPVSVVKRTEYVPQIIVNSEPAFDAVNKVLKSIPDYRDDLRNTVGRGERLTVLQKIGSGEKATYEWVEVAHSNPVTVRWILIKEIQKYYAKALTICELEGPKFDAKVEYHSLAADTIRDAAIKVVDAFLDNSEVVQDWTEPVPIPDAVVNPDTATQFRCALHESYSDLNKLEEPFAKALDGVGKQWFRNPSRGFFEIPLLDRGKTKNFNPDFFVWNGSRKLVAIDTKGSHLLKTDAGRKLFLIRDNSKRSLVIRFVSDGQWEDLDTQKRKDGFTVWLMKNGRLTPIVVDTMDEAVKVCFRD